LQILHAGGGTIVVWFKCNYCSD